MAKNGWSSEYTSIKLPHTTKKDLNIDKKTGDTIPDEKKYNEELKSYITAENQKSDPIVQALYIEMVKLNDTKEECKVKLVGQTEEYSVQREKRDSAAGHVAHRFAFTNKD